MAYASVTFTGDGSDTTFSFAGISQMFPNSFLSFQSQLDVYVDGVLKTPTTDWSVTDTVSKIITFTVAPSNGATIKIVRDTKKDSLLHTFSSGSIITAADLNNNTKQIFYITQELVDGLGDSVALTPAGDKWNFEGKPTFNGAPAEDSSGFTTLAQVTALLQGATVGTFDEVDSFKFSGDGVLTQFDLTGITKTGLTADAVIVQVNGVVQDPDVFTPSHTPAGSIGNGSRTSIYRKLILPYTVFKSQAPGSTGTGSSGTESDGSDSVDTIDAPVISGGSNEISTIRIHQLALGEVCSDWGIDLVTGFTGGAATFTLSVKDSSGNLEDGSSEKILYTGSNPPNTFGNTFTDTGRVLPVLSAANGDIYISVQFGTPVANLTAGMVHIWLKIEAPNTNDVTSVSVSGTSEINSDKYTLTYVGQTPRITFSNPPANGSVIIVRVLSGTFQGYISDGSIGSDQLANDSVGIDKINVGAGAANRVLIFDSSGNPTASVATSSLISNFDTQVRTSRLDQMAVPTNTVNVNNQVLSNVAAGSASTDAVNKGQLDAAVSTVGASVFRSTGHSVPANTLTAIAYPSGFTTYPKAVAVRLMSSSSIAYGSTSGNSADTALFYTDGGATEARTASNISLSSGSHTGVWIEVTGTTSGINIRHNGSTFTHCDIIWFK